jgi:hypothetical protein
MRSSERFLSAHATSVLLVEADLDARAKHEQALSLAGYAVVTVSACPEANDVLAADIVLIDVPSFHWLQDQQLGYMPPLVALAGDARGGVTACLCGAAAWVPAQGDGEYLLDTIDGVLHPTRLTGNG